MDSSVASNAVVATVGMYTQALAEKDRELAELKEQARQAAELFTNLSRSLESATPGLRVASGIDAVLLAITAVREGAGLLARATEQWNQIKLAKAALRELGNVVNPSMPGVAPDGIVELVACVAKEVVDLKTKVQWMNGGEFTPEYSAAVSAVLSAARGYAKGGDRQRLLSAADSMYAIESGKETAVAHG